MPLTVQATLPVPEANAYASVETVRAFALARGVNLPADDSGVEVLIIKGMDYLEANIDEYCGFPTDDAQFLSFPRDGQPVPRKLIEALGHLVIIASTGVDLMPNDLQTPFIIREKLDVIETEYAKPTAGSNGNRPHFPIVDNLLASLICGNGGQFSLRTIRV